MKCKHCDKAERYDRPEWHRDCSKGNTRSGISFNMATGESVWIEPFIVTCDCDHEIAVTA